MPSAVRPVTSFREIYEQNADYVWRLLLRFGVSDGDADDLAQEVFVVVHRTLPSFDYRAAIRTWLYGIAWRVAMNYRRARARRPPTESPDRLADVRTPELEASQRQALARLDAALRALPEEQRDIFVAFEIEQLPMRAIAEAMGIPLQTGFSRLRSARTKVIAAMRHQEAKP